MLRLRKSEQQISGELRIPSEDAREAIEDVRHTLGRCGMLYLVENPEIVSIHGETTDAPDLPVPAQQIGLVNKMIIKEFIRVLRESIEAMPAHQSDLLRLRYRNELTVGEIVSFHSKGGIPLIPGKKAGEVTEQDIYYAINVALKAVLEQLKTRYGRELGTELEHLKAVFEEFVI